MEWLDWEHWCSAAASESTWGAPWGCLRLKAASWQGAGSVGCKHHLQSGLVVYEARGSTDMMDGVCMAGSREEGVDKIR